MSYYDKRVAPYISAGQCIVFMNTRIVLENKEAGTVLIERKGRLVTCPRCAYEWVYSGTNQFVCKCARCHTAITLNPVRKSRRQIPRVAGAED